jgi:hypothetical protein
MAKTRVNKKTMRKRRTVRRRTRGGANNNNFLGAINTTLFNNNNNNSNVENNMDALTVKLLEVAENNGLNEAKQTDRLLKLIEKGADLLAVSDDLPTRGMTILDIAIANGRKNQAFALMDVFDKSPMNNQGSIYNLAHDYWSEGGGIDQWLSYTPLMHAAETGDIDIVKALLQRGADILLEDGNDDTAANKASGELKTMLREIEGATTQRKSKPSTYQNVLLKYGIRNMPQAVPGNYIPINQRPRGAPGTNKLRNIPGSSNGSALGAGAGAGQ